MSFQFFPPDSRCNFILAHDLIARLNCIENSTPNCTCPVTQGMQDFLNLTDSKIYFQAYCLNPPSDDTCSFGYCPNGDIAGPLVRIASYITNLCLSILIFYSPATAESAVWSQVLTMYSFLITCILSINQRSLTRYHAIFALMLAFSPLSVFLIIYAIISFFYKKHRLNMIMGDKNMLNRMLLLVAGALWVGVLIYVLLPTRISNFSQDSCEEMMNINGLFIAPILLLGALIRLSPGPAIIIIVPVCLTVISWVVALILKRKTIWPPGEKWSLHIGRAWSVVGRNYSFIHFMTLVVIPNATWIFMLEVTSFLVGADEELTLSFGQVLAMFVALPPLISVVRLAPRFWNYLKNLSWIKRIRGRGRRANFKKTTADSLGDNEKLTSAAGSIAGHEEAEDWKSDVDIELRSRRSRSRSRSPPRIVDEPRSLLKRQAIRLSPQGHVFLHLCFYCYCFLPMWVQHAPILHCRD
ncbi:hypothetical protein K474DRAFT_608040 [Panus rudis PR-1116 ss-1]|nr:hypothetical protein K474DRAFT_608040 [Panus rudis PR-1116 ss-1]